MNKEECKHEGSNPAVLNAPPGWSYQGISILSVEEWILRQQKHGVQVHHCQMRAQKENSILETCVLTMKSFQEIQDESNLQGGDIEKHQRKKNVMLR